MKFVIYATSNKNIEGSILYRDKDFDEYYSIIDIKNLDELKELVKREGKIIIKQTFSPYPTGEEWEIEIYDDYRE